MNDPLPDPPHVFCQQAAGQIQGHLPQFRQVDWLETVESTNALLLEQTRRLPQAQHWPRLVGSEHQTRGRGRAGRPWIDKPGNALMFSCGFLMSIRARELAGLAPALGIAACAALRTLAPGQAHRLTMKWPNDLMLDDAKLAGILVETRLQPDHVFIVAGIGLNLRGAQVLQTELNREVRDWTSLAADVNDKVVLASTIAQAWFDCLSGYNTGRLQHLISQLQSFDYLRDKPVQVIQGDQVLLSGSACGLAEDASLLVRSDDGCVNRVTVGDVSVRKTQTRQDPQAGNPPCPPPAGTP